MDSIEAHKKTTAVIVGKTERTIRMEDVIHGVFGSSSEVKKSPPIKSGALKSFALFRPLSATRKENAPVGDVKQYETLLAVL
jgi:hypothetical protein